MARTLKTITFVYVPRQDRIVAAINAGLDDAWSCWLTRRLTLAVIERATSYLESKSDLAQGAPSNLRGDLIAFERDAALANTAGAMTKTPTDILKSSTDAATELAERLTISQHGSRFRLELRGSHDDGTVGGFTPAELQRLIQMMQVEVTKAGWLAVPGKAIAAPAPPSVASPAAKPVRH